MDDYMYNLCFIALFVIHYIAESYIEYSDNKNGRL